jgi:4-hydroxy-tetrahydrodipicolinate synthase
MAELEGLLPAMVTPLSPDGSRVDEPALRDLVDRLVGEGVDGLLACGGTGEFASLTDDERRQVAQVVCEQAAGRVPVIVHAGACATSIAQDFSVHAAEVGAAAILLTVPYFEPIDETEASAYYAAVAESVDLPLIAYNQPGCTTLHQSTEFLLQLAKDVPSVRYVKDSSGDIAQLHDLIAEDDKIRVFNGIDSLFGPALMLGGRSAITGSLNFLGPIFVRMLSAARANDLDTVAHLWQAMYPVAKLLERSSYNSAVKAGCAAIGYPAGSPRHPALPLASDQETRLSSALKTLQEVTGVKLGSE